MKYGEKSFLAQIFFTFFPVIHPFSLKRMNGIFLNLQGCFVIQLPLALQKGIILNEKLELQEQLFGEVFFWGLMVHPSGVKWDGEIHVK